MKKLLPVVIALFSICGLAQAPNGFNYQASVRDANGALVTEQSVSFKFHIVQGTQTAAPTYTETHATNTDDLGQVSVVIGQGNATSGTFSSIDWSLGSYFLKIEVELSAGSGYVDLGTTQFMSVPYALYAQNAGGSLPQGTSSGDTLKWNASTSSWEVSSSSLSPIVISTISGNPAVINDYINNKFIYGSIGYNIESDGGNTINSKGIVYGTSSDPSVENDTVVDDGPGIGNGYIDIILDEETLYYYRAFATNSNGTFYGDTYVFETSEFIDIDNDNDGVSNDNDYCPNSLPGDEVTQYGCTIAEQQGEVIYLAENGVTVKCKPWAVVGNVYNLNGIDYWIVDDSNFNPVANFNMCTSKVTTMANAFNDKSPYEGINVSSWDTSSVTDMSYMFYNNPVFNQDISSWDTSNVMNMSKMFQNNNAFNQDISSWDTSRVTDMSYMFFINSAFNQDISSWDTSSVTTMQAMFGNSSAFNSALLGWVLAPNVESMFNGMDSVFNHPSASSWDTSSVTDMDYMFSNNSAFNQDISSWDTSNVTSMHGMFEHDSSFNQDIGNWNVSNVNSMQYMFNNNSVFNKDIGNWDTRSVTNMTGMFQNNSAFNQDIGNWNVSNLDSMRYMFRNSSVFNQDLSSWNVVNVGDHYGFDWDTIQWTLPKPIF